jgi:hypothetical protein
MHVSPDFVAAIIFGVIMMVIGLVAIWIVYWQTGVLLRQQQRERFLPIFRTHPLYLALLISRSGQAIQKHKEPANLPD